MKVEELSGAVLDLWVARAIGYDSLCAVPIELRGHTGSDESAEGGNSWKPSVDWWQGGPLIDRFRIGWYQCAEWESPGHYVEGVWVDGRPPREPKWAAAVDGAPNYSSYFENEFVGDTPLVAAMRALVYSVFGPTVDE